jgi:hypothetical protein
MPDTKTVAPARRYANWLEVGFSQDEFVIDFGQQFDDHAPQAHSGVVITPRVARAFVDTLQLSLEEHRRCYPGGDPDEAP